jgi:microcystin degradation protein MlrC
MKKYRIGIAFFYHESHSFTPVQTTLSDFKDEALLRGEELLEHYQNTKTELGGFIDKLSTYENIEIVPLLSASAIPSGVVTSEAYNEIEDMMLSEIRQALPLDGMLLALHGAMVVENMDDPEETLLAQITKTIGESIPIATTLDMHANLGEKMVHYTPLHFGFKTYPHVDMYDQGVSAASALMDVIVDKKVYFAAFSKLPMLLPSLNMKTDEGPMKKMMDYSMEYEAHEDIHNVSIFGGFPYADIQSGGASVLVIATKPDAAQSCCDELSKRYWALKDEFLMHLPTISQAIAVAETYEGNKPLVLADISDNPLSCGTGDTTGLLDALLQSNISNALFGCLYDPVSIEKCIQAGEGALVDLELGGKIVPYYGLPIKVTAKVMKIKNGIFYNSGPFNHNLKVDLKNSVHIQVNSIDIVLIGRAMSANDPEIFRHLDITIEDKKVLVLKVKNHFLAAFKPLIEETIYVDAPGVSTNNLTLLPYTNIPRPIWPLDSIKR